MGGYIGNAGALILVGTVGLGGALAVGPAHADVLAADAVAAERDAYRAAMDELRRQVAAEPAIPQRSRQAVPIATDASSAAASSTPPAESESDPVAEQFRRDYEQFAARVVETQDGPATDAEREAAGIATRNPIVLTTAFSGGTFRDDSEGLEGIRLGPEIGLSTTVGDWFLSAVGSYTRLDASYEFPPGTETTDAVGGRVSAGYNFAPALGWPDNWFLQGFMTVGGEILSVETERGTEADPSARNSSQGTEWQVFASPLLNLATRQGPWFLSGGFSTVHSLYTEESKTDSAGNRTESSTTVGTLVQAPLDVQRDFPVSLFGEEATFTPGFGITPAYALTGVDPGEDAFSLTLRPSVRLAFERFSLFADGAIQTLNRDDSMVGRVGIDIPL